MNRPKVYKYGQHLSFWQVFRLPGSLAAFSTVGLVSALMGDGGWDVFSWISLGIPCLLLGWHIWPRDLPDRRIGRK